MEDWCWTGQASKNDDNSREEHSEPGSIVLS